MRHLILLMLAVMGAAFLPAASLSAEPGPLVRAVLSGDPSRVQAALRDGAAVDTVDPVAGLSALHVALAEGGPRDPQIVDALIAARANLEAEDGRGLTPLVTSLVVTRTGPFAVIERARAAVLAERLLRAGAQPNRVGASGDTALRVAVATDNLEAVRHLLAAGADPLLRSADRPSALHLARSTGRSRDIVAALEAAAPRFAARGGVTLPEPEAKPATESSSLSSWIIGGAALLAAAAVAALVASQAGRSEPAATATATATAVVNVTQPPQPTPRPPVHCLYGTLPGGGCKPPPPGQCVIIGNQRIGDCRW